MAEMLYADKLVEITPDAIILRNFYFPFGCRRLRWDEIDSVTTEQPTLHTGKWRAWGTGDLMLRTWFPLDPKRYKRDKIFFVTLKGSSRRIGFTAEDSAKVETVLRSNNVPVH